MTAMINRLVIVSHVVHYRQNGVVSAFGPYARDIEMWADLFPEIVIAAPCMDAEPSRDSLAFEHPNITVCPIGLVDGWSRVAKLRRLARLPIVVFELCRVMRSADAIHVRCPGYLGHLGVWLARPFSRYRYATYQGQWNGYDGEPLTGRVERSLLKSRWWARPVTVFGHWPNQPPHVRPFFTAMMSEEQIVAAAASAERQRVSTPLRVLFIGRLVDVKRVDVLIEAVANLVADGIGIELRVVGDGPQRGLLERRSTELGIASVTEFAGAQPFDQALENYEWADCLVLPSVQTEGWPKVLAEAMCYGLICVAVDHGQIAMMLSGRGVLLTGGEVGQFAAALRAIAEDPEAYHSMARCASQWSRNYSLEGLRSALIELLESAWGVTLW